MSRTPTNHKGRITLATGLTIGGLVWVATGLFADVPLPGAAGFVAAGAVALGIAGCLIARLAGE